MVISTPKNNNNYFLLEGMHTSILPDLKHFQNYESEILKITPKGLRSTRTPTQKHSASARAAEAIQQLNYGIDDLVLQRLLQGVYIHGKPRRIGTQARA